MLVVAWLHILIILRKIFFTLVECDAGVESALDKHIAFIFNRRISIYFIFLLRTLTRITVFVADFLT